MHGMCLITSLLFKAQESQTENYFSKKKDF